MEHNEAVSLSATKQMCAHISCTAAFWLQHIRENNLDLGKLTDAIVGGEPPILPSMLHESAMQHNPVVLSPSTRIHDQKFSCLALTVC